MELCKDFVDDTSHGLTNRVLQRVYDQITEERKIKALAKKVDDSKDENSKDEPDKTEPEPESKYKRKSATKKV